MSLRFKRGADTAAMIALTFANTRYPLTFWDVGAAQTDPPPAPPMACN